MFKTVEESRVEISQLMLPSFTNFGGKIHGGYILGLMDQIAFSCASKHSQGYCVTASVDKVNFLNPIEVGELVTMKASINYVGTSSMVVGIRVISENIRTGKTKHCNSSYFTMVALDDSGKTIKVPGLKLKTKIDAKRFIKAIKRRESESEKNKTLSLVYKNVDNYLDELKNYRVQIDF
ncbi:acyl-CoA thioesterase [Winogradskyella sp. DF17]|uniref:Acyl-CoA thioesterase n=1 Tax=Winogradskyella pelagia TaxID=2819984 RepID=A0ABS3SZW7_9FLAO|nr:acyl-CoA thioesterase [Winogradskyella sp. DF17]MBO3116030.1 acyl-CoA thioesterase [Winogradskyella sp. DF17]